MTPPAKFDRKAKEFANYIPESVRMHQPTLQLYLQDKFKIKNPEALREYTSRLLINIDKTAEDKKINDFIRDQGEEGVFEEGERTGGYSVQEFKNDLGSILDSTGRSTDKRIGEFVQKYGVREELVRSLVSELLKIHSPFEKVIEVKGKPVYVLKMVPSKAGLVEKKVRTYPNRQTVEYAYQREVVLRRGVSGTSYRIPKPAPLTGYNIKYREYKNVPALFFFNNKGKLLTWKKLTHK